MKSPVYEPSAGNLLAFLNSSTEVLMCDLFTFTASNGQVYRYTDAATVVSQPPNAAYPTGRTWTIGPKIDRSKVSCSVGVEVDSLTVTLSAETTVTVGGVPIVQAFGQGFFDNGTVLVERMFFNSSGQLQGILWVFAGMMGEVVAQRGHAQIEVLSFMQLMQVQIPSALYQPSCRNTLYDLNCGLSRTAYTLTSAVSSVSSGSLFGASFAGVAVVVADYFDMGVIAFTSGANAGLTRTIKQQLGTGAAVTVQTIAAFPNPIHVGDAFKIYPGCDKTRPTCQAKYNNLVHFAGEPYIPVPQMVT